MPQRDKGEDDQVGDDGAGRVAGGAEAGPAQRDVDVAQQPAVVAAVPAAPEGQGAVVVADAAQHVLRGVDAVGQAPEAEEAPGQEQLEPDDVQVEVGQEGDLRGRVRAPFRPRLGDGAHVVVVQDQLHREEGEREAQGVLERARPRERGRLVALLGDVVVKGNDGPREVERGVDGVGEVVAEAVVLGRGRDGDAITL